MTNALDTLRPEVREAVAAIDKGNGVFVNGDDCEGGIAWATVRAELLRLTDENARLLAANRDAIDHFEQMKAERDSARRMHAERDEELQDALGRAENAEAELAALQARLDALMLEFCPDDMTDEQLAVWAARQKPVED